MFTLSDFAKAAKGPTQSLASTGLSELDAVTGGLKDRSVWVVSGRPRSGRSMLVLQFARLLAEAGHPVRFVLGRDDVGEVTARWRAATHGRALPACRATPLDVDDPVAAWPVEFDPDHTVSSCVNPAVVLA